jgi:hypothetical protein
MGSIPFILLAIACYARYAIYVHETQYTTQSISNYQCFAKNNISDIIVFAFNAFGNQGVIYTSLDQIAFAKSAGIQYTDILVNAFPNFYPPTFTPVQIAQAVSKEYGGKVNMVWLRAGDMGNGIVTNQNYLKQLSDSFTAAKMTVGIFATKEEWSSGYGEWIGLSSLNLLYLGNAQANFNDFVKFGGWTNPSMKLFNDDATYCKLTVGHLYY